MDCVSDLKQCEMHHVCTVCTVLYRNCTQALAIFFQGKMAKIRPTVQLYTVFDFYFAYSVYLIKKLD